MRKNHRVTYVALLAAIAGCTTSPSVLEATSAATIDPVATTDTAVAVETYDANGVAVSFYDTITCPDDLDQLCTGVFHMNLARDGLSFELFEDSDYFVTSATVNGTPIPGTTFDEVRFNAETLGFPIGGMIDTAGDYFVNAMGNPDKTLKDKIKCVLKALGLAGKLTAATFACSGCFATIMGAELGPPDWIAGLLTCSSCAKLTGKSIKGLYDLIKTCNNNPAMATATDLSPDPSTTAL